MEKLQIELNNQSMQEKPTSLNLSDRKAIAIHLVKLSALQNLGLDESQINIWVDQIEKDLTQAVITPKDVKYALEEMSKVQLYNRFDYATFWDLAENSPFKRERFYEKMLKECRERR